jgi:hypothetical protein
MTENHQYPRVRQSAMKHYRDQQPFLLIPISIEQSAHQTSVSEIKSICRHKYLLKVRPVTKIDGDRESLMLFVTDVAKVVKSGADIARFQLDTSANYGGEQRPILSNQKFN